MIPSSSFMSFFVIFWTLKGCGGAFNELIGGLIEQKDLNMICGLTADA